MAADPATGEVVRILVPADEPDGLGHGIRVLEAYRGFVLAQASPTAVSGLRARGWIVVPEDTFTLHVNGYVFDTRAPVTVPDALARSSDPGPTAYDLIQFLGPIKAAWREQVEALGLRVVGYVPNNAYVVRATATQMAAVRALPFVQWTGAYAPAFRIDPGLLEARGIVDVKIVTFDQEPVRPILDALSAAGLRPIGRWAGGVGVAAWGQYPDFGLVRARLDPRELAAVARLNGVRYIEPAADPVLLNQQPQYVLQTNATTEGPGARRIWDEGIRGEGQTIAFADTGIDYDHAMFRENATQVVRKGGDLYNVTDMARRKVVRYFTMSQTVGVDPWTDPEATKDSPSPLCLATTGHGTATASTAAGSDDGIGGSANDGMAPAAKIVEIDIGNVTFNATSGCRDELSFIPDDWSRMFGPGYEAGARVFSNSWALGTSNYTLESRMVDAFVWDHPDALVLWAAGNTPASRNVSTPGAAKNDVAVGGARGDSATMREWMGDSSPGPTPDGRLKPDVTTIFATAFPGEVAYSDGDLTTRNSGEFGFAGTSYSTPLAAGMAALARQYFEEGWYPTGVRGGTPRLPSAALLKALLAASGAQMTGRGSCPSWDPYYPNNAQGWGRIVLDDALYFPNDTRKLYVVDEKAGLATGDTPTFHVRLGSSGETLRVLLAWSDYPADPGANPALVNDLDLLVTDPSGATYLGNVRGPCSEGQTVGGGTFDARNTMEGVVRRAPAAGEWTIQVIGANVPMGPQPYGLVILGNLVSIPSPVPPVAVTANLAGAGSADVHVTWQTPPGPPVDKFRIYGGTSYDATGAGYALLADNVPNTAASWDHVGAGGGDPESHFYSVEAVNAAGSARSAEQAAKFARPVEAGWNLLSVPLTLQDPSLTSALRTMSWQVARMYAPSDGGDPWKVWSVAKGDGDLRSVSTGAALWVDVTTPGVFAVAGQVPRQTTLALAPGWNLVGYASFLAMPASAAFPEALGVTEMEAYSSALPYNLQAVPLTTVLQAGNAYWVRASAGGDWTVTN